MTPEDLRYTSSHEWVKREGDTATVGITNHAQESLGDITFVELPTAGLELQAGQECAVIESVKAASDIYTPVPGCVIEANDALAGTPELINQEPYGDGWLFKLKVMDVDAVDALMDAAAYEASL